MFKPQIMVSLSPDTRRSTTASYVDCIHVVVLMSRKDFQFVDSVFDTKNSHLADVYKPWMRVLLISDATVSGHYSACWDMYFKHYGIPLTTFIMAGGEKNKTINTMLSIVDAIDKFGLVRKEPVLVVGGG